KRSKAVFSPGQRSSSFASRNPSALASYSASAFEATSLGSRVGTSIRFDEQATASSGRSRSNQTRAFMVYLPDDRRDDFLPCERGSRVGLALHRQMMLLTLRGFS